MNIKSKKRAVLSTIDWISSILPTFFWLFLILGFEEPHIAFISIAAATVHEAGHISYLSRQLGRPKLRGALSGFRISSGIGLTYGQQLKAYLAGPAVNLIMFIGFSIAAPLLGEWAFDIAIVNLATAISNLMPIEGYDGYGIIHTLIQKYGKAIQGERVLKRISTGLTFIFCVLSLYLIDRWGGGYWIFAVYFISTIKCIRDDLNN